MTEREYTIIRTLENKIAIAENNNQNILFVTRDVLKEILATLKEQETRVISLDEAVDGNHCYYLEFRYHLDCGWVKCDFDRMYLDGEVAMLFSREKTFYQQAEHYGILWRLWNKRPTYDQRKEMKWDD